MAFFNNRELLQELGFGTKNYKTRVRFLNTDGSVNVKRSGLGLLRNLDVFHWLISTTAFKLNLVILIWYIFINSFFACTYFLIGPEHFGGLDVPVGSTFRELSALFFFSAQTITTLGYGHVYPIGELASTAASIESLLGLLSFAVATGVLYGRFSRPKAHILYSDSLLIAPYKEGKAIMFRLVNKKQSELIESEVKVNVTFTNAASNKREFYSLRLEIEKINFLPFSWTIVHPLNDESPIAGYSFKDYESLDFEFLVLFKAINDTVSQNVYSRFSYKPEQIIDQAKFLPMDQKVDKKGRVVIDVNDVNKFQKLN
ncbi:MAG: ion channel [Bacteroidia bacterium]|jgi:inward rectifier potassium channel|nr:ion channel [Bacteroidia bacterium]